MTGHLTGDADFQPGILGTSLKEVLMSDTSQIALIRKLYAANGDVNSFKSLLADDLEWDIAEGFSNGGVYRGLEKTFSGFFPFLAEFDEFYAKGDEYFESGDHVIVLGHYFGVSKKGRRMQCPRVRGTGGIYPRSDSVGWVRAGDRADRNRGEFSDRPLPAP